MNYLLWSGIYNVDVENDVVCFYLFEVVDVGICQVGIGVYQLVVVYGLYVGGFDIDFFYCFCLGFYCDGIFDFKWFVEENNEIRK